MKVRINFRFVPFSSTRKKEKKLFFSLFFPLLVDEAIRFPNATLPVDERRLL
jgi:hypothetical protein